MTIGVILAERVYAGLLAEHVLQGKLRSSPPESVKLDADDDNSLVEMPTDGVIHAICELVTDLAKGNEAVYQRGRHCAPRV